MSFFLCEFFEFVPLLCGFLCFFLDVFCWVLFDFFFFYFLSLLLLYLDFVLVAFLVVFFGEGSWG